MGRIPVRVKAIFGVIALLAVFSVPVQTQAQSCVLSVGSPSYDVGSSPHWVTYPLTNNTGGTVDLSGVTISWGNPLDTALTRVLEEFGATYWTSSSNTSPTVVSFSTVTIAAGATLSVRFEFTGAYPASTNIDACNAVITSPTATPTATHTPTPTATPSTPVPTATALPKKSNSFGLMRSVPVVTSPFTIEALPIPTANPTSVAQLSAFNWGVDEMNTIGSVTVTTLKFMDNFRVAWVFVIGLAMLVLKWMYEFVTDKKVPNKAIDVSGATGIYYDVQAAPVEQELAELREARLALRDARLDEAVNRDEYRLASRQLTQLSAERRAELRELRNRKRTTNKLISFAKRRRR